MRVPHDMTKADRGSQVGLPDPSWARTAWSDRKGRDRRRELVVPAREGKGRTQRHQQRPGEPDDGRSLALLIPQLADPQIRQDRHAEEIAKVDREA